MQSLKPQIIVICGPTGIGKTSTAIRLAEKFHGEIVSADSMQIYQLMDIGTAKPTESEKAQVPHHLVDVVAPDMPYDAVNFKQQASAIIREIQGRGRLPFIVGGTGFYIKALLYGLFDTKSRDMAIRNRLKKLAVSDAPALYQRLAKCDPETAKRLHVNDTYRVIRALEVYEVTGIPISQHQKNHRFQKSAYKSLKIGLILDRETLYGRINERVATMLQLGLLDEVKMLLEKGYAPSLKSMQSIGYRHMADFLEGRLSWEEAVRTLKRDTRRYAKRQLTWFRQDAEITWVSPLEIEKMEKMVKHFLHSQ